MAEKYFETNSLIIVQSCKCDRFEGQGDVILQTRLSYKIYPILTKFNFRG